MSDDGQDIVARELAQMREEYARNLLAELPALAAQATALADETVDAAVAADTGGDSLAPAAALRDRLHRVAGAAGTFGFTAIGEHCRGYERRLIAALETGDIACVRELGREIALGLQADAAAVYAPEPLDPQLFARSPDEPGAAVPSPEDLPTTARRGADGRSYVAVLSREAPNDSLLAAAVAGLGFQVSAFDNVEALAEACADRPARAIIIDRDHADDRVASGIEAGEHLNANLGEAKWPLLVIGESSDFSEQLRAVRAGVEAFFAEPLSPVALAEHLDQLVLQERERAPRVLIVDDDEATLAYHRRILERAGFTIRALTQPEKALDALPGFGPDVVVLDVNMPRCSGPELAQMMRYDSRWQQVPIVYLSAVADAGRQMQAMTRAGDDFIVKPVVPVALVASLNSQVRRARTLARLMSSDSLTGLLNHADIKQQLVRLVEERTDDKTPICVAMIDIDHFKSINDGHGHPAGDEVIRKLAGVLRRRLRGSDFVGRYGGEEFMAVLRNCGLDDARRILDDLREIFGGLSFAAAGQTFSATFSAGLHQLETAEDAEAAIAAADRQLYRAKHAGRNRIADRFSV